MALLGKFTSPSAVKVPRAVNVPAGDMVRPPSLVWSALDTLIGALPAQSGPSRLGLQPGSTHSARSGVTTTKNTKLKRRPAPIPSAMAKLFFFDKLEKKFVFIRPPFFFDFTQTSFYNKVAVLVI